MTFNCKKGLGGLEKYQNLKRKMEMGTWIRKSRVSMQSAIRKVEWPF